MAIVRGGGDVIRDGIACTSRAIAVIFGDGDSQYGGDGDGDVMEMK